jgi:hypothetical protein
MHVLEVFDTTYHTSHGVPEDDGAKITETFVLVPGFLFLAAK